MRITFIGGGNMAVALIGGLKRQGFSAAGIQVVEPNAESRERLTETFGVRCTSAIDAASLRCEALVLAVKPQIMREAIAPLAGKLDGQVVVSIAAGLRIAALSRWLGDYRRLVRAMPNTPALIGAGTTGLVADASVDREGREQAERILKALAHAREDCGAFSPHNLTAATVMLYCRSCCGCLCQRGTAAMCHICKTVTPGSAPT